MYTLNSNALASRYDLKMLPELDALISEITGITIPFNNYLTGPYAYNHKAGIHLKAIYLNPGTYEVIPPEAFGVERRLQIGSRLTGRHAIARRAADLNITLDDEAIRSVTQSVKALADNGDLSTDEVDNLLLKAHGRNVE